MAWQSIRAARLAVPQPAYAIQTHDDSILPMHVKLDRRRLRRVRPLRIAWPAQAVEALGVETVVTDELPKLRRGREVVGVVDPEADVVVIQRPLQRTMADAIPYLQGRLGLRRRASS